MDELPFGGTCALRGCDPKKVRRRGAEVVDAARLRRGKGAHDPGLAIDWLALMAFKRSFTDLVPAKRAPRPGPISFISASVWRHAGRPWRPRGQPGLNASVS
jgi:hypothetical protein